MSKRLSNLTREQAQAMELWHNLFRMHGYLEVTMIHEDLTQKERPRLLQQADQLLRTSFERVKTLVPQDWHGQLEPPPELRSDHGEKGTGQDPDDVRDHPG